MIIESIYFVFDSRFRKNAAKMPPVLSERSNKTSRSPNNSPRIGIRGLRCIRSITVIKVIRTCVYICLALIVAYEGCSASFPAAPTWQIYDNRRVIGSEQITIEGKTKGGKSSFSTVIHKVHRAYECEVDNWNIKVEKSMLPNSSK